MIYNDFIGTPFAELQSVDINLQELRTGQQRLRDMLEKIEEEEKQLDSIIIAFMVILFKDVFYF